MVLWTHHDIFDFEYLLHRYSDGDEASLHQRDRSIYLGLTPKEQSSHPQELLFSWLQAMRDRVNSDNKTNPILPGAVVCETLKMLTILLPVGGVILGLCAGAAFFSYSGTTPVNVFHFLFFFVFSQLLLLLLLLISAPPRLAGRLQRSFPVMFRVYLRLLIRLSSWLQERGEVSSSAEKRLRREQIGGIVKKTARSHGALLYWSIFTLIQQVLIGINSGILAATLFRVATSDLAFGWQSTVQFSSSALFRLVQFIALPWSWLVSDKIAYPSLSAIEGSRIILKDGIYHLATENLIAWWPFLILCLIVYGLLTRLLLAGAGHYFQSRAFKNISFTTADSMSILRRMQTPTVSTQAMPTSASIAPQQFVPTKPEPGSKEKESSTYAITLLIPSDIALQYQDDRMMMLLKLQGFTVKHQHIVMEQYESDQSLLKQIADSSEADDGFLLIQESWMPPIGDLFHFIKALRNSVGTEISIYIGLIGKPLKTNTFSPPEALERNVWIQKIAGVGDPNLSVIELIDPGNHPESANDP